MKLKEILSGVEIVEPIEFEDIDIKGIAYDSRKVENDSIFVCIPGYKTDGHDYAYGAAFKGASVIIAERDVDLKNIKALVIKVKNSRQVLSKISANFFGQPTKNFKVFGITGTNGKTTITYMIKSVLEAFGKECGLLGTIAYRFGNKEYESVNTTPESYELQKMFNEMREAQIDYCVMEVSSHSLSLSRADDIHFDYGVFTNLTPDHLDFHENFDDYYNAKKKLFYMTQKNNIINIDDEYGRRLANELRADGKSLITYSVRDKEADFYAEILEETDRYSLIEVLKNNASIGMISIKIPGVFSVYNALATIAVCITAEIPLEVVKSGIENLKGVPGRFEMVENTKNVLAIVDYAHTPDALEKVLKTAHGFKKGRLICVFGCGGDRDRTKRPLMGKVAGELSDYCIITSDNPRTEDPIQILNDAEEGIYDTGCNYELMVNRYEAIEKAVSLYKKGDIIIIAGKGHEDYQIIGTEKTHFDDREVTRAIVENMEKLK